MTVVCWHRNGPHWPAVCQALVVGGEDRRGFHPPDVDALRWQTDKQSQVITQVQLRKVLQGREVQMFREWERKGLMTFFGPGMAPWERHWRWDMSDDRREPGEERRCLYSRQWVASAGPSISKWEGPLPVYWRTWFAHFQFNTHFGGRVMSHLQQVRYTDGVCSYLEGRAVLLSPFFVSLCCLLQPSLLCKYCLPWLPLSKIKILPTPRVFVAHEFLLSSVVKWPWLQSSYNSHCCLEIRVP